MSSLNSRLAAYFAERPLVWLDGMELSRVAGSYAWRSRCSDLRRLHGMAIENRQRKVNGFTVSEYRYVPADVAVEKAAL